MVALRDGSPIVDARPTEGVHAQAKPRALDRRHIDDVPQIADVRVEIVVPVRRGGAQRLLVWDAFHAFEAALQQLIRSGFNPAGDAAIGRSPIWGVVLEPAVVRRIVRRRNDNAVGQAPAHGAPAVVAHDSVRYRGRRCVRVVLGEHDVDAVGREHLDRGGARRHGQGMRVEAEKQRAANPLLPAVAADGLADREHVPFVEGLLERRPAMARRAEGDALGGHGGIGNLGVVGRDQLRDVEQHRLGRWMARERTDRHGVKSAAAAASTHQRTRPLEGAIACAGNSCGR